jgi:recombination protein RecT
MGVAISTQIESLRGQLEQKRENLFAAAAEHMRFDKMKEQVARACITNPDLLDCTRSSLFLAISEAASLGLEIDSVLGHAYLVPYKNKGVKEVQLIPGYLGLKELAFRSGKVVGISGEPVYCDDDFDFEYGTEHYIRHKPSPSAAKSTPTYVYAIVRLAGGGKEFKVMSWPQVEAHRNKFAKGWERNGSAWQTSGPAMGIKTCLRRTLKLCPLSPELQLLLQREELVEQPPFASGMEAPVEDLDAAAELLEDKREPRPSDPTPEELADMRREQEAERRAHGDLWPEKAAAQSEIPF